LVLVGESEVYVQDSLLTVGPLVPFNVTHLVFSLLLLLVVFLFSLVGCGLLPHRVNASAFSSLTKVELGALLFALLGLVFF
jgi:hypothetical protein